MIVTRWYGSSHYIQQEQKSTNAVADATWLKHADSSQCAIIAPPLSFSPPLTFPPCTWTSPPSARDADSYISFVHLPPPSSLSKSTNGRPKAILAHFLSCNADVVPRGRHIDLSRWQHHKHIRIVRQAGQDEVEARCGNGKFVERVRDGWRVCVGEQRMLECFDEIGKFLDTVEADRKPVVFSEKEGTVALF